MELTFRIWQVATQAAMTEAFTSLEKAAKDLNLFINQEKTKYMPVNKKSHASYPHYLKVGPYKLQTVHIFTYLGSDVNCNSDISAEIKKKTYLSCKQPLLRTEKASEVTLDLKKR
jgi:hypothetical protein